MAKTEHTFKLIKALTQNEKRFFRLFANLAKGEKNYLHVFNALESLKEYDAEKLKKKLQGKIMKLSHEQNYLQKQILKAMRIFHAENNAEYQLNGMLSDIKFLFAKEQLALCRSTIDSAKRLASAKQLYPQLIHLLDYDYDLQGNTVSGTPQESIKTKRAIGKEMKSALAAIQTNFDHILLCSETVVKMQEKNRVRGIDDASFFKKILDHPLLKIKNIDHLPANAQFAYHATFLYYYVAINQFSKAHQEGKKNMALLESYPEVVILSPRGFYNTCNNYMYTCLFSKNYAELKTFMKNYKEGHYKKLPIDFSMIKNLMEESLLNFTLAIAIHSKDLPLGLKTITEYENKFAEYEKLINEEMRVGLYQKMARINFLAGKLKDALRFVNRILNTTDPDMRPDMQSTARILNLIIHFELGNTDLLESTIASTKRFLEKKKMLYQIETVFLDFMKNILKTSKEKEKQKYFISLREKLNVLKKDPLEKNAFLYFDYLEWVEEKL